MRTKHTSGLSFETSFHYSRAVAVGNTLYTAATAPVTDELDVIGDNAYDQLRTVVDKLAPVLKEAGFALSDVVHVRVYFAHSGDLGEIGRAFADAFSDTRPALTAITVLPFDLEAIRLELELIAVRDDD